MDNIWLEWLGYLASFIVLVSLLMSSLLKLRWINMIGSGIFAVYGLLIGSLPVAIMNTGIVCINIYYLIGIYTSRDDYKILPASNNHQYYNYFMDYHAKDIKKFMNTTTFDVSNMDLCFFVLRNMVPAGIIGGRKFDENTLEIELDFVIPEYRDFKIAKYVYDKKKETFTSQGYSRLICFSSNPDHIKYLEKMGFTPSNEPGEKCYMKNLIK